MLSQNLSQKMLQKLSPQQIQLMKLLQIPTATIDQRIKEELEANPALDESPEGQTESTLTEDTGTADEPDNQDDGQDELDLTEYIEDYAEDDPISYRNTSQSESRGSMPVALTSTFNDYLEQQLGLLDFQDEREELIAEQILGSIDDDGYLRREPVSIIDDLLFAQSVQATEEEVLALLKKIQRFDPPGVGARDLRECLLIQLRQKMENDRSADGKVHPHRELAYKILEFYFDEFSKKHYQKLQKQLEITEADLRGAIDEILKLNPKPASAYGGSDSSNLNYVVPDFIITNRDGVLELTINSRNLPDLRINEQYVDMLRSYNNRKKQGLTTEHDKQAILFIKQKIDSAKWFIDAIRQRQQTLYRTMYAIMQFQEAYFRTGDARRIKPMILKDIAEITDLDISTVSRVASSKYVQTEFGTRKLKDFFSESVVTTGGEEVSTLEVKNALSEIVSGENKRKPYSDEKLKSMLLQRGYDIARRTVAKYREQLNIPVARLRKEL
jgi:RNA polymerase sigma-54 factor